jgi:hypothetical protein
MKIFILQSILFFFFTDVVVQFTNILSSVTEGSRFATVQLSATGERAINVTVKYVQVTILFEPL